MAFFTTECHTWHKHKDCPELLPAGAMASRAGVMICDCSCHKGNPGGPPGPQQLPANEEPEA